MASGAAPEGVNWVLALGYGVPSAILGGAVWGAIAAFTGYIIGLVAILLGLLIAVAVRKGAGTVTWGTIVVAAVLTIVSVFVGQIVAIAIVIAAAFGGTFLDAIALYPLYVAIAPGDVAIAFFFGLLGVGAGARHLWREMRAAQAATQTSTYSVPIPTGPLGTPAASDVAASPQTVTVKVLSRGRPRAAAEVYVPGPRTRIIHVEFESALGTATIAIDGVPFSKVRVWGREKKVDVPLNGETPQRLTVRFWGTVTPRIDVSLGDALLAQI